MSIKNTEVDNINIEVNSLYYLEAPVQEKQTIGNVKIQIKDETIGTLNIQSQRAIGRKEAKDYFMDFLNLLP